MKQPPFHSLRIGHRTYLVKFVNAPLLYDGNEVDGLCCKHVGEITVVKRPDTEAMKATLWHEVFHGIWNEQGVDESDNEERIIAAFERGYMQVVLDNPELMKWTLKAIS